MVTTLPLTKAETKTEKSLTPPSYSCSEKKKNFASKCQLFVTGVMVSWSAFDETKYVCLLYCQISSF